MITLFKRTFPNFNLVTYTRAIEKNLKDCKSILDVGCGNNSCVRFFSSKYKSVGIDGYKPSLKLSKERGIHDDYIHTDINKIMSKVDKKSFDATISLDVIEHLTKEDGHKFLDNLEKIAKKKIVIVTPNGFMIQHNEVNGLQEHLSGWTVEDFKKRGYKVQGLYGLRILAAFRSKDGGMRLKPELFWKLIWGLTSELTHHLYAKKNPQHAFALLAVKKIS